MPLFNAYTRFNGLHQNSELYSHKKSQVVPYSLLLSRPPNLLAQLPIITMLDPCKPKGRLKSANAPFRVTTLGIDAIALHKRTGRLQHTRIVSHQAISEAHRISQHRRRRDRSAQLLGSEHQGLPLFRYALDAPPDPQ